MEKTNRKGGARPGSGAKPYGDQLKARELVQLGSDVCIQALKREGEFKDLDKITWLDLASRFALKAIPQVVEAEITEKKYQEIVLKISELTSDDLRGLIQIGGVRALPERAA